MHSSRMRTANFGGCQYRVPCLGGGGEYEGMGNLGVPIPLSDGRVLTPLVTHPPFPWTDIHLWKHYFRLKKDGNQVA